MKHKAVNRRSTAATLAAALALGGGLSLAGLLPAFADDVEVPAVTPEATGSIVVTKYANPHGVTHENYAPGTGAASQSIPTGSEPVEGVYFRICPVTGYYLEVGEGEINLAFPEGSTPADYEWWTVAKEIAEAYYTHHRAGLQATSCYDNDGALAQEDGGSPTDSTGTVVFTGLDLGLYLVEETVVDESAPVQNILKTDPYLVTLPYRMEGSTEWITPGADEGDAYGVWTFPKNGTFLVDKTADTTGTTSVGSTVEFTIRTEIPFKVETNFKDTANSGKQNITRFVMTDTMDPEFSFPAQPESVTIGEGASAITLVNSTDPEVHYWTWNPSVVAGAPGTAGTPAVPGDPATCLADDVPLVGWEPSSDAEADELACEAEEGFSYTAATAGTPAVPGTPGTPGVATLTFETDGLAVINSFPVGTPVFVVYEATVKAINSTTANAVQADVVNTVDVDWESVVDSDETHTPFGGVMIHKYDRAYNHLITTTTGQDSAVFEIYAQDPSSAGAAPIFATNEAGSGSGKVFTTGVGPQTIGILGLFYDDKAPNCFADIDDAGALFPGDDGYADIENSFLDYLDEYQLEGEDYDWANKKLEYQPGTTYWVVETQAPTGYLLDQTPVAVCVSGVLDNSEGFTYDDFIVTNMPDNLGIQLPFTGEFVKTVPFILGMIVIVGAFTTYVVRTRRVNARRAI